MKVGDIVKPVRPWKIISSRNKSVKYLKVFGFSKLGDNDVFLEDLIFHEQFVMSKDCIKVVLHLSL